MRLENSELRAFRAVIEEGGFKRAADALHISQSAVSQAVAGLEFPGPFEERFEVISLEIQQVEQVFLHGDLFSAPSLRFSVAWPR